MERTTTVIPQADVERQLDCCRKIAALTAQWDKQPLAFVDTYGCQQNEADSERIRGYLAQMGFGFTDDEEQIRREFTTAANFFDEVKSTYFADAEHFRERSWGMSDDYPIAIECRSTMVRVGTKIFGPRVY